MSDAQRLSTHVMSCSATVLAVDGDAGPGIARLHELEQRWSRFIPESDVTRLNLSQGASCRVSSDTIRLVEAMQLGWRATTGSFDPMLLGVLVEAGYGSSRDNPGQRTQLATPWRRCRPDEIEVDSNSSTITLPAGAAIDPGGIGKGLAADLVVAELLAAGATGALVEVGGDIRVGGESPDAELGWTIAVGSESIGLTSGAVATSTTLRRTWSWAGEQLHHLIDPATLTSSANGVVTCTVMAGSCAWAEVFTKVAFALPVDHAFEMYNRFGLAAAISTDVGERISTDNWKTFVR